MNVLDGEWVEPEIDRELTVQIKMPESLVRDCREDALARLVGPDVARAAKKLIEESDD